MAKRIYSTLFGCMVSLTLIVGGANLAGAERPSRKAAPPDPTADAARYELWHETVAWNAAVAWGYASRASAYAAAVAQLEAENAARVTTPVASAPKSSQTATQDVSRPSTPNPAPRVSGGGGGGSCGGATNGADRFIAAESGGNPTARNSSGAWGCYQIMPGTWSSSCSDLGSHGSASTSAQAACASRLPSSSWAATGG